MSIRRLSPLLVNQIAAGEVIERPASVVKELVENAIDAGATRIEIEIEAGGKDRVRVTDDGVGVPFEELALALASHATSKIATAEDLDAIATMGFRGEALASIASVSRLSLLSRPRTSDRAGVIEAEGAELSSPRPGAGPPGTTVIVRNLFFNTPARRKFLKTDQTETARIGEIVTRLALANPSIGFTLETERGRRLDVPAAQTPRQRVIDCLGAELKTELLEVDAPGVDRSAIGIWGMIGTPDIARGTSRHIRTYLNGRPIMDRTVNHAIAEAYRGLIDPTRSPTVVLFLRVDPALVDVNVHPAKAEVRFRRAGEVHHAVLHAVRSRLREADLTPALALSPSSASGARQPELGAGRGSVVRTPTTAGAVVDSFHRLDRSAKGFVYSELKSALAQASPDTPSIDAVLPTVRTAIDALQVHASYIVTQDEDGVLIIDQHALHERVMFEKLKERVEHSALESQRLLMPRTLEVDARELERLDTLQPLLERLGIEASPLGPTSIAVHAFTTLLFERGVEPDAFMAELLSRAADRGLPAEPEAALHEVLDMMSCKAAIKAGDRLEPREIAELLAYRERVERSSNCPHGRPTTLRLSLTELERQFGRR